MSKVSLTTTTAVRNSSAIVTETIVGGGLTGTDGLQIATGSTPDEKILISIRKENGATGSIWIKAGSFDASGQGDLQITIAAGGSYIIGPLEGARLKSLSGQTGYLYLDAGVTGIVSIAKLP